MKQLKFVVSEKSPLQSYHDMDGDVLKNGDIGEFEDKKAAELLEDYPHNFEAVKGRAPKN